MDAETERETKKWAAKCAELRGHDAKFVHWKTKAKLENGGSAWGAGGRWGGGLDWGDGREWGEVHTLAVSVFV